MSATAKLIPLPTVNEGTPQLQNLCDLLGKVLNCLKSDYIQSGPSALEIINELLVVRARAGKSANYIRGLRIQLLRIFRGRLKRPLASIRTLELEQWIFQPQWSARYQRNLVISAKTLFSFAQQRGYVSSNPASAVEPPPLENKPVEIQTPEEVAAVLRTARRMEPALARLLAIQYFAGLRSNEAQHLTESNILDKYIEVTAANAKTRRRRLVTIQPVLRAWLDLGGRLPVRQVQTKLAALRQACGVPCPHNAARHSFCSYHLANFQSAAKTALEAGHSEAILFRHYRELVTPETAARYWQLRPEKD